jgi:D-3-phosphoglycerate dehydrogenase
VRAIGRAGAGVNNIPVAAMSARGIPVFNAPGANANAVKELVIAGLIVGSRHLCQGWDFARGLTGTDTELHKAVEAGKKQFVGSEITNRTIGVVGLGAIGRSVAKAAAALGMRVVGFDPALTIESAAELGPAIHRVETLQELLAAAEFLTVHVPLVESTRGLIGATEMAKMRKGAIVLNFAREGIVDEAAVIASIDAGHLAGYVSDFPVNQTKNHPKCVTFPHLGASTEEAEENCAIMVADQIRSFLEHGHIHNSVNFPEVNQPRTTPHRLVSAATSKAAIGDRVPDVLQKAGLSAHSLATVLRGDLVYLVADLKDAVTDEAIAGIRAIDGVLMARKV